MIQYLNPANQRFLSDIQRTQRKQSNAEAAISSGLKVRVASDDPDHIDILLATRGELQKAKQIKNNLDQFKTEVDTAEVTLQSAVKSLERARTLGTQGLNDAAASNQRPILATEVEAILTQLVSASRASVQGRYIFSGDTDQAAPYTVDLTAANGVAAYTGSLTSTRVAENTDGVRFKIAQTADQIFDNATPEKSVFGAVNALRLALANNDTTAIQSALANVQTSAEHLNNQLAFYGTAQGQITTAIDQGNRRQLSLRSQISQIEDADLPESILELNQSKIALDAAFQAHSLLPRKSLFDYLFG